MFFQQCQCLFFHQFRWFSPPVPILFLHVLWLYLAHNYCIPTIQKIFPHTNQFIFYFNSDDFSPTNQFIFYYNSEDFSPTNQFIFYYKLEDFSPTNQFIFCYNSEDFSPTNQFIFCYNSDDFFYNAVNFVNKAMGFFLQFGDFSYNSIDFVNKSLLIIKRVYARRIILKADPF